MKSPVMMAQLAVARMNVNEKTRHKDKSFLLSWRTLKTNISQEQRYLIRYHRSAVDVSAQITKVFLQAQRSSFAC